MIFFIYYYPNTGLQIILSKDIIIIYLSRPFLLCLEVLIMSINHEVINLLVIPISTITTHHSSILTHISLYDSQFILQPIEMYKIFAVLRLTTMKKKLTKTKKKNLFSFRRLKISKRAK